MFLQLQLVDCSFRIRSNLRKSEKKFQKSESSNFIDPSDFLVFANIFFSLSDSFVHWSDRCCMIRAKLRKKRIEDYLHVSLMLIMSIDGVYCMCVTKHNFEFLKRRFCLRPFFSLFSKITKKESSLSSRKCDNHILFNASCESNGSRIIPC